MNLVASSAPENDSLNATPAAAFAVLGGEPVVVPGLDVPGVDVEVVDVVVVDVEEGNVVVVSVVAGASIT